MGFFTTAIGAIGRAFSSSLSNAKQTSNGQHIARSSDTVIAVTSTILPQVTNVSLATKARIAIQGNGVIKDKEHRSPNAQEELDFFRSVFDFTEQSQAPAENSEVEKAIELAKEFLPYGILEARDQANVVLRGLEVAGRYFTKFAGGENPFVEPDYYEAFNLALRIGLKLRSDSTPLEIITLLRLLNKGKTKKYEDYEEQELVTFKLSTLQANLNVGRIKIRFPYGGFVKSIDRICPQAEIYGANSRVFKVLKANEREVICTLAA